MKKQYVQFIPSVEVWGILKEKPNKTAFIEESVLKNHATETMTFDTMKSDLNKLQDDLNEDLKLKKHCKNSLCI